MSRYMLSRLIAAAGLAAAAFAFGAGHASASTSIPNTALPVSATGEDVNDPQVAVDPSGNAFHAWVVDQPGAGTLKFIQAARVSSAGVVGTVNTVSIATENASSPAVAAAPDGTGIVVWQEFQSASSDRRIRSVRINANGTLGTAQTMSNTSNDVTDPDVGIDGTGKALVVWTNLDGVDAIEARTRSAADALGSIEDAASSPSLPIEDPDLAVAPGGEAMLVFHKPGALEDVRWKRRRTDGVWEDGNLGTAAGTGPITGTQDSPQVAIDPTGDADAVIVSRVVFGGATQIRARRIESTETNDVGGPIQSITEGDQNSDQPQVDMDGAGKAYMTWRRSNGTVTVPQWAVLGLGFFATGSGQNLNGTGTLNGDQPQVAVDTAGNATFAWRFGLNIQTRSLTSAGNLTPIQALTSSGSNTEPRVDANAAGARWGAYRVDTAGNDQAFGFFDLTASLPTDTTPPETTITSGPADGSTTTQTMVTFGFSANEPASFTCSLDGGLATLGCSGPHTVGPLALGTHTFEVRATDTALNVDPTPAQRSFTVVAGAPPTLVTPVPGPSTPAPPKCRKGQKLKKGKCAKKKRKKK